MLEPLPTEGSIVFSMLYEITFEIIMSHTALKCLQGSNQPKSTYRHPAKLICEGKREFRQGHSMCFTVSSRAYQNSVTLQISSILRMKDGWTFSSSPGSFNVKLRVIVRIWPFR